MSMIIFPARFATSGTWTPASLATAPAFWFHDGTTVSDDGTGKAAFWDDFSSNTASRFVAPGVGVSATIISSGQNGRRVLRFNGTNAAMAGQANLKSATNNISAWSMFVAGSPTKNTSASTMRLINFSRNGDTSARASMYAISSNMEAFQRRLDSNSAVGVNASQPDSNWHVYESFHNWTGQTVSIALDGNSATSSSTSQGSGNTQASTSNEVSICGAVSGSVGQYLAADIGEILLLGYIPSTTDLQKIEGYMAWHWGTQANLPSGHPYKTAAP